MSELDDAMLEYMTYIVCEEQRSFSYRDFISFEVNEKNYGMKHGTFRNKASMLTRDGKIERVCNSALAFYTLKGHMVPKPMTPYHEGAAYYNNPLFDFILGLTYGNNGIHNIRLSFKVNKLWTYTERLILLLLGLGLTKKTNGQVDFKNFLNIFMKGINIMSKLYGDQAKTYFKQKHT